MWAPSGAPVSRVMLVVVTGSRTGICNITGGGGLEIEAHERNGKAVDPTCTLLQQRHTRRTAICARLLCRWMVCSEITILVTLSRRAGRRQAHVMLVVPFMGCAQRVPR